MKNDSCCSFSPHHHGFKKCTGDETQMDTVLNREPQKTIFIDTEDTAELSPYIFGHNLEHTRAAVCGGLSAQMLRNRKFCGKPSPYGIAVEWEGIGTRAFFRLGGEDPESGERYTRHIGCENMQRSNELTSMSVQNVHGGVCGLRQTGLYLEGGRVYELRIAAKSCLSVRLTASLTDRRGRYVYAETSFDLIPGDWRKLNAVLTPSSADDDAGIAFTFTEKTQVLFGAVSLMPADHFHGMRKDVVACLRQISPTVIRWPGGNFAGEYRWMDGLLPVDRRGPLQSCMETETQPYSHGYDNHESGTDDFIALCREVGAEPFLTINPVWSTPEESARWVEYCNGSADTEYGAKRAENGSEEPYHVRFWSLGNEMGYGHMEGPRTPADYAKLAQQHADAMLAADPGIELFSSGPYPNDTWAEKSAGALFPKAKYVSLHHYSGTLLNFTEDRIEETYYAIVNAVREHAERIARMRESLDRFSPGSRISFDEWNFWYAWFRPSCVAEGIFTAKMLHMLIDFSDRYAMPFGTFFQPVNEGAIDVTPEGARLTADGQMFAMARGHHDGRRCRIDGADAFTAAATVNNGDVYVTVVNDSFDRERDFVIFGPAGKAEGILYTSEDVTPHTFFEEKPLAIGSDETGYSISLPPHSVAALTIHTGRIR